MRRIYMCKWFFESQFCQDLVYELLIIFNGVPSGVLRTEF